MYMILCTRIKFLPALLLFFLLNGGLAVSAQGLIKGTITLPNGTPMQGVGVMLTGTDNDITITDSNGEYVFAAQPGGSYEVKPISNSNAAAANPLNGVSTYDIALIMRHVLGIEPLSPYQIIAADVNSSGSVTVYDSLVIRQLILGMTTSFPNNANWKFVRAAQVFPNPFSPFPYDDSAAFSNFSGFEGEVNFVGIKLGDVNNSVIMTNWGTEDDYYLSRVTGNVYQDADSDCGYDPGETPLANWLVVASGFSGEFVANTANDGSYTIILPDGDFSVQLVAPNDLWSVCSAPQPVHIEFQDTLTVDLFAEATVLCPHLEVDIAHDFLRRCYSSYTSVEYCNTGTEVAPDAYVEVSLDPYLVLLNSSVPWSSYSGNTYTFQLGDLAVGQCGSIYLDVLVSCDATLGQTHCSSAHIFPDSLCVSSSAWNGADLRVTGVCEGDQVVFTVTNEGASMTEPAEYVIIEDIMIQMDEQSLQLEHNESEILTVSANGSTWRLEIDQPANHPWSLIASAAVEGCGTNASGGTSAGIINLFPQDDNAPFEDEACIENVGSYDPNDKQGFPRGIGAEHFIPKGEDIEYLIRFQNTGTDTAFIVLIRDTISPLFDLSTFRAGASSHPYTHSLLGQGVAQFTFSNIMLPDSNVNEAASHGFIKFTISPKADLPDGTQLENQAGIYFDFNEPVITNRTLHTIGEPEQYLEVTQVENLQAGVSLSVFPNPASVEATFHLQTAQSLQGDFLLYDLRGRELKRVALSNNTFKISVSELPAGPYFFMIQSEGNTLASGKMIVRGDK